MCVCVCMYVCTHTHTHTRTHTHTHAHTHTTVYIISQYYLRLTLLTLSKHHKSALSYTIIFSIITIVIINLLKLLDILNALYLQCSSLQLQYGYSINWPASAVAN